MVGPCGGLDAAQVEGELAGVRVLVTVWAPLLGLSGPWVGSAVGEVEPLAEAEEPVLSPQALRAPVETTPRPASRTRRRDMVFMSSMVACRCQDMAPAM